MDAADTIGTAAVDPTSTHRYEPWCEGEVRRPLRAGADRDEIVGGFRPLPWRIRG